MNKKSPTQIAILTVIFDGTEPNPVIHATRQVLVTKCNKARFHLSGDLNGSLLIGSFIHDRNLSKRRQICHFRLQCITQNR